MSLSDGTILGAYEITGQIGAGGMGEVYRATDSKLGRDVAIKTLPAALASDKDRLARFEREAKLLAALNHPHIASVYSLDEHEGTLYLAMELVEGETLEDQLRHGALPIDDALRLALQIAEALEAAHDKGVVHRDLKPANIMVDTQGQVKVLDFGLAKAFSNEPDEAIPEQSPALSLAMTQQGIILGTAGYMSPEQASGQPTDQRADVWAFGVVLFEIVSGLPLFTGESVPHILAGILRMEPEWDRLPKDLDPRIRALLERCLEKKARNRYHGIADARVDIERILADPDGAPVQVAGPAPAAPGSRLQWLAGVLTAAIIAAVAAWVAKPVPAPEPPRVVHFDFALNEGQVFRGTRRDVLTVSADGAQIVYNTNQGLFLRQVGDLESRLIPGTSQALTNPSFSPDGNWIAFWEGATAQLKKIPTAGGSAVVLTGANNPQGLSWNLDGSTIIYGQPGEGIMEVSANGGQPSVLVPESAGGSWDPQYLPDGAVLFTQFGTNSGARVVIRMPGATEDLLAFPGERAIYTATGHLIATDPAAAPTALFARTLDLDAGEVGGPVPVAQNVAYGNNKTHYAISANGTLVSVYGEPTVGAAGGEASDLLLTIIDRDGVRRPLDAPPRPYRNPRISPDGTQVAVEIVNGDGTGSAIWIYDLSGETDIRRLTQVNEGNNLRPVWTLDGESIAFMSDRDGPGSIYVQPAYGSAPAERLTTADEGTFHLPESWAPDGSLSFGLIRGDFSASSWGVWMRDPVGEIAVFHELDIGNQFASAFSPDGQWLAYASGEVSSNVTDFRVFVERYPKTGERYEVAVEGASYPVWSRDGTEIFYRRGFGDQTRVLNSVTILETEPRFRFTTADSVEIEGYINNANYRDFDPLPDGSGWIMLTPANEPSTSAQGANAVSGQPRRINVVLNWFRELQERVPVD